MDMRGVLLVTEKNHAWAAEESGLSREEVKKAFDEADKEGIVCVLQRKVHVPE